MEFKDSKDFSLLFFVWVFIKNLEKIIEKRFCSKCWGNNNKLWFLLRDDSLQSNNFLVPDNNLETVGN
jgi:hypothetical protein